MPSTKAATTLAARMSSGNPSKACGTRSMRSSRAAAPTPPPTKTKRMALNMGISGISSGEESADPARDKASNDRDQDVEQRRAPTGLVGELRRVELHATEGCVAAEHSGQNPGVQLRTVSVVPVDAEQHGEEADHERAADIDEERRKGEPASIVLIDKATDGPPQHCPSPPAEKDPEEVERRQSSQPSTTSYEHETPPSFPSAARAAPGS